MDSMKLITDNGDYLERHYANEILQRLPGYALFWARYVGNNGQSKPLPMNNVSDEVLRQRDLIWEHLYTLFESFALCWRIEQRFKELEAIRSPINYADNLNDWIAFYAHLGRIRDMAKKTAEEFNNGKNNGLYSQFNEFYEIRHTVLHYPKVPMKWVESVLQAPSLGETKGSWWQRMNWTDLDRLNFEFIEESISKLLRDYEKVANRFLLRIADLAQSQKGFQCVEWPATNLRTSSISTDLSWPLTSGTLSFPPSGSLGGQSDQ